MEKTDAKVVRIVIYSVGKVSVVLSLGGVRPQLTLHFVNVQMDKV